MGEVKIFVNDFIIVGKACSYKIMRKETNDETGNLYFKEYGSFGNLKHAYSKLARLLLDEKSKDVKGIKEIKKLYTEKIDLIIDVLEGNIKEILEEMEG